MSVHPLNTKITEVEDAYWQATESHAADHAVFRERQLVGRTYEVYGLRLTCPAGIYQPDELSSTRMILRELVTAAEGFGPRVLDVGTGSGAIALVLARLGKEVTAIDVDPEAIACARANAEANGVAVRALCSDLFSALEGERFDLIVFNAPLSHDRIEHPVDRVARDPDGALTLRFLREAPRHLTPNGFVALLASSVGRREAFVEGLAPFDHRVIAAEYSGTWGLFRWLVRAAPK